VQLLVWSQEQGDDLRTGLSSPVTQCVCRSVRVCGSEAVYSSLEQLIKMKGVATPTF
jgi:hypothetical protein